MGSYNVACSLSGQTIHEGEEVLYVFLEASYMHKHNVQQLASGAYNPDTFRFDSGDALVSNDGALINWSPIGFALEGTYEDSGILDNIKKDINTDILEGHFGIKVENIQEMIHRGRRREDIEKENDTEITDAMWDELRSLSGMWILKRFWDKLKANYKSFVNAATEPYINKYFFEKMGFECQGEIESSEIKGRTCLAYKHPESDVIVEVSDMSAYCKVGKKECSSYWIGKFTQKWEDATGIHLDISEYENMSHFDYVANEFLMEFEESRAYMQRLLKSALENSKTEEEKETIIEAFSGVTSSRCRPICFGEFSKYANVYYKHEDFTKLNKHMSEMVGLKRAFFDANRMFAPANQGEQCGNNFAEMRHAISHVESVMANSCVQQLISKGDEWEPARQTEMIFYLEKLRKEISELLDK